MPVYISTRIQRFVSLFSAIFLAVPFSYAQEKPTSPATVPSPISTYPDKAAGLERLAKDILRAIKIGDRGRSDQLLASLVMKDPAKWYVEVFGASTGEQLARQYERDRSDLPRRLGESFQEVAGEHVHGLEARKYENSCDDQAGELVFPVLMARVKPVPLYEIRFSKGNQLFHIWTFAYVDGGFRYLRNLHPRGSLGPMKSAVDLQRIVVPQNVAAAKLVHQVPPRYPSIARDERLEGTVRLHALIGKDGLIHQLRVVRGYCSLAEASLEAVRQWRYTPTLLNGKPVEIDTMIEVHFTLRFR